MRLFLAICIAFLPFNFLRITFYRLFLGYKISYKSKVKPFNILLCKELCIEEHAGFSGYFNLVMGVNKMTIRKNSYIIKFNRFRFFNICEIAENVKIASSNVFFGTPGNISPFKEYENLRIKQKSIITNKHIFDLSDQISIGEDVTFGGSGSQVWTHGFDLHHTKKQSPIEIGDCCYIGSSSIILPGIKICNNVSIGTGTIVSKSIEESGFYVSSGLTRKSDLPDLKKDPTVVEKGGYYFLRKQN